MGVHGREIRHPRAEGSAPAQLENWVGTAPRDDTADGNQVGNPLRTAMSQFPVNFEPVIRTVFEFGAPFASARNCSTTSAGVDTVLPVIFRRGDGR